jgi:hypothetical protein
MPKKPVSKARVIGTLLTIVVLALILGMLIRFWPSPSGTSPDRPVDEAQKIPPEPKPVIDYGKIEEEGELKELIEDRKEQVGVDQGVDIIAEADETIRVGDTLVPMQEILDKIRINRGEILEKDLERSTTNGSIIRPLKKEALAATENRLAELDRKLSAPAEDMDASQRERYQTERSRLMQQLQQFEDYNNILNEIKQLQALPPSAARTQKMASLQERSQALAEGLEEYLDETDMGEQPTLYGIYVVQPGDNIWNIHFKFLRNYFRRKGIALSPVSDEPTTNGFSSGIGKLLKFSEHMVYIYNLRERKLEFDLNLIHPLSKIVVFNFGEVFALLEQIDYRNVNHIQFDGETLWIPADQ